MGEIESSSLIVPVEIMIKRLRQRFGHIDTHNQTWKKRREIGGGGRERKTETEKHRERGKGGRE